LPWPVELETALLVAQHRAFVAELPHAYQVYVARWLPQLLEAAGLEDIDATAFLNVRQAPLDVQSRAYLQCYLSNVRRQVEAYLTPSQLAEFDEFAQPLGDNSFLNTTALSLAVLDWKVSGRKPP
jgi:hypothetical protein